jgi:hypothetical protein
MTLKTLGQFWKGHRFLPALAMLLLATPAAKLRGDQVETQNGERYVGKVLSFNSDTLVFQSEVLGTVKLPRSKVSHISLGTNAPLQNPPLLVMTNGPRPAPALPGTNSGPEHAAAAQELGSNSNLIQQVQAQFLNGAGPEAKEKFNQLLGGYLSGKLTVDDIRVEAKTAADQLRAARGELGGDSGFMIDSYLAILDNFLKETAPAGTNSTAPKPGAVHNGQ